MEGDGGRASRPGSMRGPLTPRGSNGHSVDGESGFTARRESNVYKDILAEMEGGARGELPTLHEQIEAVRPASAQAAPASPPAHPPARPLATAAPALRTRCLVTSEQPRPRRAGGDFRCGR